MSATRTSAQGRWVEPFERAVRIMADPDGPLVEIGQQARKHECGLRTGGLAPLDPTDEYLPAIAGLAGRVDFPDVADDDIGLLVGQVRHGSRLRKPCRGAARWRRAAPRLGPDGTRPMALRSPVEVDRTRQRPRTVAWSTWRHTVTH